jgi:hypothetical protein
MGAPLLLYELIALQSPRFPKEHGSLEGFQASPACPSYKSDYKVKISIEQW